VFSILPVFSLCDTLKEKDGLIFLSQLVGIGDPGGIRDLMQYLPGFYPVYAPTYFTVTWNGKLSISTWPKIIEQFNTRNLRSLAREYGVSHETIRRTLSAMDSQTPKAEL